jgi:hypothetical protein
VRMEVGSEGSMLSLRTRGNQAGSDRAGRIVALRAAEAVAAEACSLAGVGNCALS